MAEIRGSEVDTFLSCRRKYKYSYVDLLEPKRKQKPLYFGTLMHQWLQTYYMTKHDLSAAYRVVEETMEGTDASSMDQVEVQDVRQLLELLPYDYVMYWREADAKRRTIFTELKFRVPINNYNYYTGTFDHLYQDLDTGLFWLEDHKNVASIGRYLNSIEYNQQIRRYLYAAGELANGNGDIFVDGIWQPVIKFPRVSGLIFNLISKKLAEPPRVLKNSKLAGKLSLDKAQNTTYALYLKAVKEACGDDPIPQEYQDMLEHFRNMETSEGNKFFRRVPVLVTQPQMESAFLLVSDVSDEIWDIKDDSRYFPSHGSQCGYCGFKMLCFAQDAGDNIASIIEDFYQEKTSDSEDVDDDTDPTESQAS